VLHARTSMPAMRRQPEFRRVADAAHNNNNNTACVAASRHSTRYTGCYTLCLAVLAPIVCTYCVRGLGLDLISNCDILLVLVTHSIIYIYNVLATHSIIYIQCTYVQCIQLPRCRNQRSQSSVSQFASVCIPNLAAYNHLCPSPSMPCMPLPHSSPTTSSCTWRARNVVVSSWGKDFASICLALSNSRYPVLYTY